jgi:hypothetical protein
MPAFAARVALKRQKMAGVCRSFLSAASLIRSSGTALHLSPSSRAGPPDIQLALVARDGNCVLLVAAKLAARSVILLAQANLPSGGFMEAQRFPSRDRKPEPPPPDSRRALSSEKFWALMGRWQVPDDRALSLIGQDRPAKRTQRAGKPKFKLSEAQAEVLSCLLEIDLTLTLAEVQAQQHPGEGVLSLAGRRLPLDEMGRCDPRRAAALLWSLNRAAGFGPVTAETANEAFLADCSSIWHLVWKSRCQASAFRPTGETALMLL